MVPPLRVRRALVAALAVSLAWPAATLADWPMYGHDLANSRAAADGPPRGDVPRLRRAWRFEIGGGRVTGTPAVRGNVLVVAGGRGTVVALDARTGAVRWRRDAGDEVKASVAIAEGRVLVPVSREGAPYLLALRLKDGRRLWKRVLDRQPGADLYGSPVPWRGRVFTGVSALGAEFYSADPRSRGSVMAVDLQSGRRVWKTYTVPPGRDGGSVWSTPAIDRRSGRLFVGTGNAYHAPADAGTSAVAAFDTDGGERLATFQPAAGDWWNGHDANDPGTGPDADFGASPNLLTDAAGHALVGEAQKSGIYWALDRGSLAHRWHARVAPASQTGGVIGSTAYDGRRIYGPETIASHVWALGARGTVVWDRDDAGDLRYGPLAVSRGVVYGADGAARLVARRASDGELIRTWRLGQDSWGGVAISRARVYVTTGTFDGRPGHVVAFAAP